MKLTAIATAVAWPPSSDLGRRTSTSPRTGAHAQSLGDLTRSRRYLPADRTVANSAEATPTTSKPSKSCTAATLDVDMEIDPNRDEQHSRWVWILAPIAAAALLALAGCADSDGSPAGTDEPSESPSPTKPSAGTERRDTIETAAGGTINYLCAGEGSPAILLEAGSDSSGIDAYWPALIKPLAARTTVCTYDRPGTGLSSGAPNRRRTVDDFCQVQDQVIEALDIAAPYVLLGQSGGAMTLGCAQRHPDRVAGLVLVEGYHDDPRKARAWQKEEGWTWRDNPERFDGIDIVDELDAIRMPIGSFPVLVISATDADPGNVENQRYWLGLSPNSRQVVVKGSHDLQADNPQKIAAQTIALLDD